MSQGVQNREVYSPTDTSSCFSPPSKMFIIYYICVCSIESKALKDGDTLESLSIPSSGGVLYFKDLGKSPHVMCDHLCHGG